MNLTTLANKRHQECLDKTEAFVKAGGIIKTAPNGYVGQEWKAPVPKNRVTPNGK